MIFVSVYPNNKNEKDGMVQRIKAIDDVYFATQRSYISISLRRNLRKKVYREGVLTIYHLNLFLHFITILRLFSCAKVVYIHSLYNALKVLPVYFNSKIKVITDMHGIMPEEFSFCGNVMLSKFYNFVESVVVGHSWKLIFVTAEMSSHFECKYKRNTSSDLIIPIFNRNNQDANQEEANNTGTIPLVIYAGGVHKWQNVPLMLSAIKQRKDLRYLLLSGSPDVIRSMASTIGLTSLDIQSVAATEVFKYYQMADFGFVLRDKHLLNKVACPTKVIEYISARVVPIVLTEEIGDLNAMGYRYVTLNDFLAGNMPTQLELEEMKQQNLAVLQRLIGVMEDGLDKLRHITNTLAAT